jgi:hypothetical protein
MLGLTLKIEEASLWKYNQSITYLKVGKNSNELTI